MADGTSASGSHTVNVIGRPADTAGVATVVGVTPRLTAVDVMLGAGVDKERAGGRITWQPDAMKTKDANKSMICRSMRALKTLPDACDYNTSAHLLTWLPKGARILITS